MKSRDRGTASVWTIAMFLLIGGGLLAASGCQEEPLRLRIRVDAPGIPGEVNQVVVWFAGSSGSLDVPDTCVPTSRTYPLPADSDVPFYVDYLPGAEYRDVVHVRVEYLHVDGPVETLKAMREHAQVMPDSGTVECSMEIEESCLSSVCPTDRPQCVLGECNVVRPSGVFDDPPAYVRPGAPSCEVHYDGGSG